MNFSHNQASEIVFSSDRKLLFQQLLTEYQHNKSPIITQEAESSKIKYQKLVTQAEEYTVEHIVNTMASLQLNFGQIVAQLATELTTESEKLEELQAAIAFEKQHLQQLEQIRLVAEALDVLQKEHLSQMDSLALEQTLQQKALEQEINSAHQSWAAETAEFVRSTQETAELVEQQRISAEADYEYELERQRTIAQDDYELALKQQNRELAEQEQSQEQDWSARTQKLADVKAEFLKNQEKIAGFADRLKEEYNKAKGKAIKDAEQKHKVARELSEQEWLAQQQGYELKITALTQIVDQQRVQIEEINTQLQAANHQAQNLALQAFQNTVN